MQIKLSGVIIKQMNLGENDRIVTLLTRESGIIRAFARGTKRLGSKLFSATQLFCYGDFVIYKGKESYVINEAESSSPFYKLREDIERLSLAQYICDLACETAPKEENAAEFLRLTLNSFYALANGSKNLFLIKAAYELRVLSLAGYEPVTDCCVECGEAEGDMCFFPSKGGVVCRECITDYSGGIDVGGGVLAAMRHIISSPQERIFAFSLSDDNLRVLRYICERYTGACLERNFKTLDFFNSVCN